MEPDDLLCSRNARPPKALARATGTSRRASGWVEKLRAVRLTASAMLGNENEQAWRDH